MFLPRLAAALALCRAATPATEDKFLEHASLLFPHVGENGRHAAYDFGGHYTVLTRSPADYTQLGRSAPHTAGHVQTREPLSRRAQKIVVAFEPPRAAGSSAGFWLSDRLQAGPLAGRQAAFTGAGILFDFGAAPRVRFVDSAHSRSTKPRAIALPPGQHQLELLVEGDTLTATLNPRGTPVRIYRGPASLPRAPHFGVSAATGSDGGPLRMHSIAVYDVVRPRRAFRRGETPKSNALLLLAGGAAIAWLAYYLYRRHAAAAVLKN